MNKITIAAIGICIVLAAFASCKKKHNPSVQDNLLGKWKLNKEAIDTNGNGKMDANEVFTDTSSANYLLIFNADGTITETYLNVPARQLTWSLENNNTYLKIVDTSSGGKTTHKHIDELTSTSMTWKDTTGGTATWTIFAKQ